MHKFIVVLLAAAGVLAAPAAAPAADFSSGLGCAANCIKSALVKPSISLARVDLASDTPARFEIVVRKRTAMDKIVATKKSGDPLSKSFTTFLINLEPDTLYSISVSATDAQGRKNTRVGTFRTDKPQTTDGIGGADGLAAPPVPQYVTDIDAVPGVTAVKLGVATSKPATLRIEVGRDTVERTYTSSSDLRTSWATTMRDLRPGTRYTVVVKATDANGITSVSQATFDTRKRNIRVRFMEIRVTENAEKRSTNKGEITFVGGMSRGWQVARGESKIKDGQRVHFSNQGTIERFDVRGPFSFEVQGIERDTKGLCLDRFKTPPFEGRTGNVEINCVRKVWNTAEGTFDPATAFALDSSFEPGFEGAGTVDSRIYATDGPIRFYVDVRVDVWVE